ncbi:MAG: hypothetical protein K9M10_01715 [Candidatus Pacebacteria bacterium]|nr:hypothetical protein [Candidatus Paceibacterota bacterium]MCF7857180.1 hypothetical protein [Candidatus Paceibacterota bacterium]
MGRTGIVAGTLGLLQHLAECTAVAAQTAVGAGATVAGVVGMLVQRSVVVGTFV